MRIRIKYIFPLIVVLLIVGVFCITAGEHNYVTYSEGDNVYAVIATQPQNNGERRMVDMIADDSYLIEKGDSTIFILVGNFAAHHNGAVILADSAVRYSNQSFECFGNVLINQNSTYAYGNRASYNRMSSTATLYDDLIKVVDGEAVMYTYNCTFDTANEIGRFSGGCYVEKGESLMESERGYYYTDTHELIAVDNVEMRDDTYLMTGDSVIFNTQTEDARYFSNTNIWNDKDEYLFANEGSYTKSRDLHHLTRDAYILSPEREIWSDSIEYYRTDGHIVGRGNIQIDDTTKKILGFADYGEWWDDPGNALFTRRPSMINYDPAQSDSLFLAADTLWLYTIAVLPPGSEPDSTATTQQDSIRTEATALSTAADSLATDSTSPLATSTETERDFTDDISDSETSKEAPNEENKEQSIVKQDETPTRQTSSTEQPTIGEQQPPRQSAQHQQRDTPAQTTESVVETPADSAEGDTIVADSITTDSVVANDSIPTAKQLREHAKMEERRVQDSLRTVRDSIHSEEIRVRDSIRNEKIRVRDSIRSEKLRVRDSIRSIERHLRDSLDSIKNHERDSIRHIRDSVLQIKIDTIIAKRRAESSRIADEEAARIERIKQKSIEREHRKIDRAKARAARRGREYTGPDYTPIDSLADSMQMEGIRDSVGRGGVDSLSRDSLGTDSLALDSLGADSLNLEPPFPADSTYKLIKAYRNVRMYRTDMQMICDSLTLLNTDSIIRLYREPILWNENNQITSDSMAIYTANETISKAHFMGTPILGAEIDTMYYNQVKGKDMTAYFDNGKVYRNDVDGNAQTIYFLQDEGSPEVTGLMYIESASISFYLVDGQMDKIAYKQNPEYVIYPMTMIPETQQRRLDDFAWHDSLRPTREDVADRTIRPTRRNDAIDMQKPRFRITERIDYDRRRLTENRMWEDRVDELTPDIIEWRDSRTSYKKR